MEISSQDVRHPFIDGKLRPGLDHLHAFAKDSVGLVSPKPEDHQLRVVIRRQEPDRIGEARAFLANARGNMKAMPSIIPDVLRNLVVSRVLHSSVV